MCGTLRFVMVPKNSQPYATQTTVISRSTCHSISAYSLPWVWPAARVTTAATSASCQPQKTNEASRSEMSRTWQVRWTMYRLVANSAEPPKAKITPLVWIGRNRPKLSHGISKFSAGQYSWAAISTPTSMPTIPQKMEA